MFIADVGETHSKMDNFSSKYCICGLLVDMRKWFITCSGCYGHFHGSCVNILQRELNDLVNFFCPGCKLTAGPTVIKRRLNNHRYNYMDANAKGKPVQTGTLAFLEELKRRTFTRPDELVTILRGQQFTREYLYTYGFDVPILVDDKDGLDVIVPSRTFTIYDVEMLVGRDWKVDVIDVIQQAVIQMSLHEFVEYFTNSNRRHILNIVSLELSRTELTKFIQPPCVIRKVDWVSRAWPDPSTGDTIYSVPCVDKYCLLSTKESYTDFHIDFGGSSAWYHMIQGEKIFYLIKPTGANLILYQAWMNSPNRQETFFADQVDECYKIVVKEGQTLFIPTGWIHAVYTTKDALAFGGNFVHALNIPLQLKCYQLEKSLLTPGKFFFPNFEVTHWFGAKLLLKELKELNGNGCKCPRPILSGVKLLVAALREWSSTAKRSLHQQIPASIDVPILLKSLLKELRIAERLSNVQTPKRPLRESTRKRKRPVNKDFVEFPQTRSATKKAAEGENLALTLNVLTHLDKKPKSRSRKKTKGSPKKKGAKKSPKAVGKATRSRKKKITKLNIKPVIDSSAVIATSPSSAASSSSALRPPLKLTLPKPVTYPYSNNTIGSTELFEVEAGSSKPFDAEAGCSKSFETQAGSSKSNCPVYKAAARKVTKKSTGESSGGSLKMKVVKEADTYQIRDELRTPQYLTITPPEPIVNHSVSDVARLSIYDFQDSDDDDDDEGALVVDESPFRKSIYAPTANSASNVNISVEDSEDSQISIDMEIDKQKGMESPTSTSALPSSSTSIVPVLSTSRTPRKVLAGTLSVHRGFIPLDQKVSSSGIKDKKYELLDDQPDAADEVHQDEQYVYPSLDTSDDDEEEVIPTKKRGKKQIDEAWNPNGRIGNLVPKVNRPTRERKKNQAVEKVLEAAAAKRAAAVPKAVATPSSSALKKTKKKTCVKPKRGSKLLPSSPLLPHLGSCLLNGSCSSILESVHSSLFQKTEKKPKQARKPKKGMATAKQRLGKILKIHKMQF